MEKSNYAKSVIWQGGLLRLWLFVFVIHAISLLFGYAIFLIVLGVQLAVRRLFIHWQAARDWLIWAFELKITEQDRSSLSVNNKLLVDLFHFAATLMYVAFGFYVIKLGIDILSHNGFLEQNLIYLIFFK